MSVAHVKRVDQSLGRSLPEVLSLRTIEFLPSAILPASPSFRLTCRHTPLPLDASTRRLPSILPASPLDSHPVGGSRMNHVPSCHRVLPLVGLCMRQDYSRDGVNEPVKLVSVKHSLI
jgi:hypothetical protein